jgi:hypothetical protein
MFLPGTRRDWAFAGITPRTRALTDFLSVSRESLNRLDAAWFPERIKKE